MKVVVTGGLGFIGSHLCTALASAGHEVTAVDDLSGTYAPSWRSPECNVVIGDAATAPLDHADAVVHLAALPGVRSLVDEPSLVARNVELARAVAERARRHGARFVLASTSSVYGEAELRPTPEDAGHRPLNAYARSKVAAEDGCPDAIVARLFTVYGPAQRPDMAFARWIDALGRDQAVTWCAPDAAVRDFTYVDDAACGLVALAERGRPGHAYNIAGPAPVRVRDALAEIERLMCRRARIATIEPGVVEARVTAACGRKARDELGYEPRVGLREGLERQVQASSLTTSRASLSPLSPLYEGWRSIPSRVHAVNSISATS